MVVVAFRKKICLHFVLQSNIHFIHSTNHQHFIFTFQHTGQKNIGYAEGEIIKAGALNLISAQQSGYIARQAGLNVNSDWCQVNSYTLESIHHKHVYVIADANDADLFNQTAVVADQQTLQCVSKVKSITG